MDGYCRAVKDMVLEEHYEEPFTREPVSGSNLELRYEEEEPMYEPYMQDEELDYEPAPEPSVEEGEPIYEPDMQDEELYYEGAPDPVVEEERLAQRRAKRTRHCPSHARRKVDFTRRATCKTSLTWKIICHYRFP